MNTSVKIKGLGHPTTRAAVDARLASIASGRGVGVRRATFAHPCCQCFNRYEERPACPCGPSAHRPEGTRRGAAVKCPVH